MLTCLVIKNFGLIDDATLAFEKGLTVFTGETGAGKSMLIDALSLGVGARGGVGFVQKGSKTATIEATFQLEKNHPVRPLLEDMGLEVEDDILFLRRQVKEDGKTLCFACGMRITQGQMATLGSFLADIHGQRDQQLLLEPRHHVRLLDGFEAASDLLKSVQTHYKTWRQGDDALKALEAKAQRRTQEMDLLRIYIDELDGFAPQPQEEEVLVAERQRLMQGEKCTAALSEGLNLLEHHSPSDTLAKLERLLAPTQEGLLEGKALLAQLATACALVADLEANLTTLSQTLDPDPARLEAVDERLHAMRALARKHQCSCDDLLEKQHSLQSDFDQLAHMGENLEELAAQMQKDRAVFEKACQRLSQQRSKKAEALSASVQQHLQALKMPEAAFQVRLEPLGHEDWGPLGAERVAFYVRMNPGTSFAPLEKAASGGEVSRLMLALKSVFFASLPPQTLVFDEIDTGVGGAVAAAMGRCLKTLSFQHQVFAITHLPQVAAQGGRHMHIIKKAQKNHSQTQVLPLKNDQRRDEIARMLSGAELTSAAKQAATSLLLNK